LKILKAIGAGISITVCFFYLGCGGVQMANAAHGSTVTPLSISAHLIPSAIAGTPYVVALDATGGTPGYSWSVTSGQLPPGVSLASSTGIIAGTPTFGGAYSAEVTLSDGSSPTQKRSSTITISVAAPSLSLVTSTLPPATNALAYSIALQAAGGSGAYTWSISSGSLPTGLALASTTGNIAGRPRRSGTTTFTVTVRDGEKPAQSKSVLMSLTVLPSQLAISTLTLPAETTGSLYSQTLRAHGGTPGYTWSVSSGSLPQGLTLNTATGNISGTPSGGQSATFTATVTDSANPSQTMSSPFTIDVPEPRLTVTPAALSSATVGAAYSQALQATGGTAPYTWSSAVGSLPSGITIASNGVITGIPTVSGTFTFSAIVADSSNPIQSVAASRTIKVTPTALTVTAPTIPTIRVGSPVSQAFSVSGGTAAYTWRITSGNLPAGLALTTSGSVAGVATQSGSTTFTATATDSSSPAQTASATTAIVVAPTPLTITSSSLTGVGVGASYSQTEQVSGGSAPYNWSITAGSLPAGLNLSPSSGTISGVPTAGGTSTVTITVTDSSSPAQITSATTVLVVAPASLSITSTSLAAYTKGTAYAQSLQVIGGLAPYTWAISSGSLPTGLTLSPSGVISGTPTSTASSNFGVTATDSGSPAQTQSASFTLAATASTPAVPVATPLSIISSALASGTAGIAYTQALQATGGTPSYTWSISSGSLPAGLTLAATTGTISGSPTAAGTSSFTATVADNGSPSQTQSVSTSVTVAAAQLATGPGSTWYIRTDGGTRYSATATSGQCDGLGDNAYPGSGTNQHCAFNDFRYMWDDQSYNSGSWVMQGGDTVIIRGCAAAATQQNPDAPHCRIGWDAQSGAGAGYTWCLGGGPYGQSSYGCYNPPIPAGTATQHTRILGGNYQNCSTGNAPNTAAMAQIFGGWSVLNVLSLANTQYVDIQCIEITAHNSACTTHGIPSYPRYCNTSYPLDDYDGNGVTTSNTTSNVLLQDVSIHGHGTSGVFGPIGAGIALNRVFIGFNGFVGWNFDDGHDTLNGAGSSINASYVTMEGNGCYEQYPIVNPQFPARACYDDVSGGFGDSWSGQDSPMASFTCDHCVQMYNTKDGFIGPHTQITNLSITNSTSIFNMGQQWKWNNTTNATTVFENNLTVSGCTRLSEQIPGASQNFALSSGLGGSYLSDFCRAAGDVFSFSSQANSNVLIAGNTIITDAATIFDLNCGPAGGSAGTCGSTPFVFTDNLILAYTHPSSYPQAPGLFYLSDSSDVVTSSHNSEYGVRNADTCGTNGIVCGDPLLVNEPSQTWTTESAFDVFNPFIAGNSLAPTLSSPLIGAGVTVPGLTADYLGNVRQVPPTIGAIQP
jgi:hypothetical protein